MKSRKRLFLASGVGVIVALLFVLPFVLPLGRFIPELERLASDQIGDQVKIGSVRLFFLPLPHLTVHGIEVGKKPYLQVERVRVTPKLTSLFSEQKVIREISLRGVIVGQQTIAKVSAWVDKPASTGPAPVRFERIEVHKADINLNDFRLREVDADVDLTAVGGLSRAQVHADQGRMNATVVPQGNGFALDLTAQNWKLPAGPPLLFSNLEAKGTINSDGLDLPAIRGQLNNGALTGKLAVGWKQDWTIIGNLDAKGVELQPVAALYTEETLVSGTLSGNSVINMRAPSAAALAEAINVESDFKIEKGVLYKFDLVAAANLLASKEAIKSGQTQFDNFSGHLLIDGHGYHFSDLTISSGVLEAEGNLLITPKKELNGRIDATVKGTASLVSTTLAVAGTVQDPSVRPTNASLLGAAAGTVLLGPGVGTAVGMKAGQITEKLIGGKPANKARSGKTDPAKPELAKPETAHPEVSGRK